jgi:gag-polypeptide of LTR copia-type
MQQYLNQKRSLADRLRLIGSPISDVDLQLFILHGLNIDYDSLVVSITSRADPIPFNELSGLLLTHEQRLTKHALAVASSTSSPFPASLAPSTSASSNTPHAHLACTTSSSSLLGPPPSPDNDLLSQFSAFVASKGSWRGKNSDKPSPFAVTDRLVCQLCFKKGHTADRCYKRFDSTYKPPPPCPPSKQHYRSQPTPQALCVHPGTAPHNA